MTKINLCNEYDMSKRTIFCILAALLILYITWMDHSRGESDLKVKTNQEKRHRLTMTKAPFIKPDSFQYKGDFDKSNTISTFGVQTHPSQWMIPDS